MPLPETRAINQTRQSLYNLTAAYEHRLSGSRNHIAPEIAFGVYQFATLNRTGGGNVNVGAVPQANNDVGLTGHGGVGRVAREIIAEYGVAGVGAAAADHVAGVDILDVVEQALFLKVIPDFLFQQQADILVQFVSRSIKFARLILEKVLAGPFRHHDNGVSTVAQTLLKTIE